MFYLIVVSDSCEWLIGVGGLVTFDETCVEWKWSPYTINTLVAIYCGVLVYMRSLIEAKGLCMVVMVRGSSLLPVNAFALENIHKITHTCWDIRVARVRDETDRWWRLFSMDGVRLASKCLGDRSMCVWSSKKRSVCGVHFWRCDVCEERTTRSRANKTTTADVERQIVEERTKEATHKKWRR